MAPSLLSTEVTLEMGTLHTEKRCGDKAAFRQSCRLQEHGVGRQAISGLLRYGNGLDVSSGKQHRVLQGNVSVFPGLREL
ncbi:hypothetical protein E5288_WYG008690 [Bos mutus]|uniref:Uncharacterized protein n=1 Tax=Bos mutus TaxID=72004 RepID=A0A6B0RXP6_9CETA|nr:hypothetical protein [Bos mutus]